MLQANSSTHGLTAGRRKSGANKTVDKFTCAGREKHSIDKSAGTGRESVGHTRAMTNGFSTKLPSVGGHFINF